ncbi:hypothetical protein B0H14DRAFT_2644190 [Mycena olivaceomarginata]|nr:hypothetical protein B0H14DRAFT_2644190 [Mycena olivaceomarginata]
MAQLIDRWESRYISSEAGFIWFDCVPCSYFPPNQHAYVHFRTGITLLAFDSIGEFIFGESFGMIESGSDSVIVPKDFVIGKATDVEHYSAETVSLTHIVSMRERYNYPLGLLPKWWRPIGLRVLRKEAQAAKIFSAFVAHRLAERLSTTAAQSENARDLVGRFLHKSKAQNEEFRPESLIAELITILVAGSDTTRNSLIAALYYLAQSQNAQRDLQAELDSHMTSCASSYTDIEDLPCLMRVSTKRCGSLWGEHPEEFRPGRWLQGDGVQARLDADALRAFSDGPMRCIGKHLAMAQLRVMIAAIFKRFDVFLEVPESPLHIEEWFVRKATECRIVGYATRSQVFWLRLAVGDSWRFPLRIPFQRSPGPPRTAVVGSRTPDELPDKAAGFDLTQAPTPIGGLFRIRMDVGQISVTDANTSLVVVSYLTWRMESNFGDACKCKYSTSISSQKYLLSTMPLPSEFTSLLEVFIETARDLRTADRSVLECGQDTWTYAALETVSDAMAQELEETTGTCPKVVAVGENHPYLFALMLAVWKVGGIFIPIDAHVPPALLDGMIDIVKPTCVYLSASDNSNILAHSFQAFKVQVRVFDAEDSTIPALNQRYGHDGIARTGRQLPKSDAACLYLFTSSAFSRKNLKAVPLTHKFVLANCQSKLAWWHRMQPHKDLDGTRVLGWAPWSHVLSHMQDIGTVTILTAGCYVFQDSTDLTSKVVSGIVNKNVTALATLPFVLSGLKAACENGSPEAQVLLGALRRMTMLECGGAVLDFSVANWAELNDVPVVVGIGMTETGGAIFAGRAKEAFSGFSPKLSSQMLSFRSSEATILMGELVVKSKLLPHGYIDYDDGSFSVDEQGWVTFKTGDRYRIDESKFTWLGRITDYIQMTSGESLDPRPFEASLRSLEFISNACIIGDTFLRGASTTVCAIIELADAQSLDARAAKIKVAQVLAPINADLPPALRISMSSGEVFRKQIEDMFGAAIAMVQRSATHFESNFEQVEDELTSIIGKVLGISDMDMLTSMTFAELGMTSLLAVKLAIKLNDHLAGRIVLPINICYIHVDVLSLMTALRNSLSTTSSVPKPMIDTSVNTKEEVVIVGKAFRLPGEIPKITLCDIPPHRWDQESFSPADICFRRAGLINVASYDHTFFGLTAEAFYVSPTMRIALEVAFEALENANIPISKVKGTSMGVFVATKDDGFETLLNAAYGFDAYTRFYGTGRAPSTASGRISYLLDIHGPSITIDTACSGGIVCIDHAVAYLQSGAAESAIVCSSNTHCWPGSFMFLTAQGMASPNSRCAAFTSDADGYVPSEGAVAFILKTRSAAARDGDQVFATIKATAVSHNGKSQGLAAPNMKSQAALHRAVLRKAKNVIGDLSEIQGINEAFVSAHQHARGPLIISASKSLGHTEPSAGLVGILRQANRAVVIYSRPARSYGFSGTLADIVLEGPKEPPLQPPEYADHADPMICPCVGREHYKHRFACVATDLADLIRQLENRASAPRPNKTSHGTVWLTHRKMLLETDTEIEDHIRSDVDQICIFIHQYAICRWLKEFGIEANAVMIPSVDHHHHGGPTACPTPALRSDAQPCPHNELTTHRQHLETLLDSALATLMLIQAASASVPVFGTHIVGIIRLLNQHTTDTSPTCIPARPPPTSVATTTAATMTSAPTPAPTSTTATYAAATYAAAAASDPRPSDPSLGRRCPSALHRLRDRLLRRVPNQSHDPLASLSASTMHRRPCLDHSKPTPLLLEQEGELDPPPAVNACTASYLTEQSPFIWPAIRPLLKLPEEYDCPAFETDEHWHSVVFHAAPAPPDDRTYTRSLIEDGLAASDIPNRVFKGYSVLSRPADIRTRGSLALRVSLSSEPDALRLINKGGFMAGTWCKVTPYFTKPSSALQADLRANSPAA